MFDGSFRERAVQLAMFPALSLAEWIQRPRKGAERSIAVTKEKRGAVPKSES